jgi:taurine dioxygenase
MRIERAAGALGAYLSGVDIADAVASDAEFSAIHAALIEHQVLFLRDQPITAELLYEFAGRFGPIEGHPAYENVAGAGEVQILESTAENPSKIEQWHSDMTFGGTPPMATVLHGKVIPEVGGDTLFASMYAAYDALSEPMRQLLDGLVGVHDFRRGFAESLAEPGGAERLADAIAANPPVEHPLVRTHPDSGRKALYVNRLFTTRIRGLTPAESAALLEFLYGHMVTEEFTVRLNWQPETIAIWDNRCTQHKPVNDFFPQHRRLHRVTVAGDRPV